jgi:hypothetical protein
MLETLDVWPAKSKCLSTDCWMGGPPKVSSLKASSVSSRWLPRPSYVSSKSMLRACKQGRGWVCGRRTHRRRLPLRCLGQRRRRAAQSPGHWQSGRGPAGGWRRSRRRTWWATRGVGVDGCVCGSIKYQRSNMLAGVVTSSAVGVWAAAWACGRAGAHRQSSDVVQAVRWRLQQDATRVSG